MVGLQATTEIHGEELSGSRLFGQECLEGDGEQDDGAATIC